MGDDFLDTMVDLETLGNGSNSVIIAIGAVKFNERGLGDEFYAVVDAQSCVDAGMQINASTVMWWMQQSDEARAAFKRTGVPIGSALMSFSSFIEDGGNASHMRVWGNGAAFDNAILANAYSKCKQPAPWKFRNDRCYRTMKARYQDFDIPRVGAHHNALDDAKSQAQHMVNNIGLELVSKLI